MVSGIRKGSVNNLAVFVAAERFFGKAVGTRVQSTIEPEVEQRERADRLDELAGGPPAERSRAVDCGSLASFGLPTSSCVWLIGPQHFNVA